MRPFRYNGRLKVKVLPLEFFLTDEWLGDDPYLLECHPEIEAPLVVGKPGKYLTDTCCWFETPNGICRSLDREMFLIELRMQKASELRPEEVNALVSVSKAPRVCTKAQRSALYDYLVYVDLQETGRQARLSRLKFDKDFDNFEKESANEH